MTWGRTPSNRSVAPTAWCWSLGILQLRVGALGAWTFPEGTYLYVGSAWGPGGLRARVGRHLRGSAALRWHIDYLRAASDPVAVWLAVGLRVECTWAQALAEDPAAEIVVPAFRRLRLPLPQPPFPHRAGRCGNAQPLGIAPMAGCRTDRLLTADGLLV